MAVEVILPKVDMDMDSGVIVEWKVAEGARVAQGDVLFDLETNKSLMEVESPGSGIIRSLMPVTGEPVVVGTVVAWIHDASEVPAAPPSAQRKGETPTLAAPSKAPGRAVPSPALPPAAAQGEVRATPAARRIAREKNLDLTTIRGSGPGGRIGEEDVIAALGAPPAAELPNSPTAAAGGADRVVALSPIRRIVAERLADSARTVPHFYLTAHIDMTALRDAQRRLESDVVRSAGCKASMTLLIAYLVGRVLVRHPNLNASFEDNGIRFHAGAHVGIAVDRDGDLLVPVLRDAHARPLSELVREFAQLRADAMSGRIKPAQMRGGTFTLSNLAMYGVDMFTAIINPPECAILAIGRTVETPVGRGGQVVLRPMATFALSSDHRVVDGVTAARFMSALRDAIEVPEIAV